MRIAQSSRPNGSSEIFERPMPEPGDGSVRIKVQACGICQSESLTKGGLTLALSTRGFQVMRLQAS
jgi:D-arabinose 1-dehydrogenase-like Zn-dependent alcohol dehydrogenase